MMPLRRHRLERGRVAAPTRLGHPERKSATCTFRRPSTAVSSIGISSRREMPSRCCQGSSPSEILRSAISGFETNGGAGYGRNRPGMEGARMGRLPDADRLPALAGSKRDEVTSKMSEAFAGAEEVITPLRMCLRDRSPANCQLAGHVPFRTQRYCSSLTSARVRERERQ
jgi:hypothetical protein